MTLQIKKAEKFGCSLRLALYGPSGSGKSFTALSIAHAIKGDKQVLVIDSERGSASKYADSFAPYDVIEIDNFHPTTYVDAITLAVRAKEYSVLIIDSATQEWDGSSGALELAGHNFANWANVTPLHNKFVDAMLTANLHVIVTMRAKEEYSMQPVEQASGKTKNVVQKMGMEPIQRKGIAYEFDIVASLSMENVMSIEKTRCSHLKDATFQPGHEQEFVSIAAAWLDGKPRVFAVEDIKKRANVLYPRAKTAKLCTTPQEFLDFIGKVLEIDIVKIETLSMNDLDAVDAKIAENESTAA